MRRRLLAISGYLIVVIALTISAAAVGLAGQMRPEPSAKSPAATSSRVDVTRARKGHRLPVIAPLRAVPQQPAAVKRVPVGCEPAISPLARPTINFLGYCVS